jgi:A/G-specific adenine glycosylase
MTDSQKKEERILARAEKFRAASGDTGKTGVMPNRRIQEFRSIIYGYYREKKRDFPWRRTSDPYHILVSEIMLQQTQTDRVRAKYIEFIDRFRSIESLAEAELSDVLKCWQGLGYNRRGMFLHRLAIQVMEQLDGRIPDEPRDLQLLPGIGKATAASICAFAFNKPVVFIETNIRTIFLFFFFPDERSVPDCSLYPLVEITLDRNAPAQWYSALMDFGSMLKKRYPNPGRKSAHYGRQPPFKGSRRELRGLIMRELLSGSGVSLKRLTEVSGRPASVVRKAAEDLAGEGLLKKHGKSYYINNRTR